MALLAPSASAAERAGYNARYDVVTQRELPADERQRARVAVTGVDETRGVPTVAMAARPFPVAPTSVPREAEAVARHFLRERAALYRITPAAVDAARLQQIHDTGRGGIVVTLRPRLGGIDVIHNDAKVLLTRELELVAIGGNLRQEAAGAATVGSFLHDPAEAVAWALSDLTRSAVDASVLENARTDAAGAQRFDLGKAPGWVFTEAARARAVWFPQGDQLVPAHHVEVFVASVDGVDDHIYAYVVAADRPRLLFRQNLVHADSYDYRVFAEPDGLHRPLDGPIADYTPHPTGIPDGSYPAHMAPVLISMEGFNSTSDPWLPPNATESFGNNVRAYTDDESPGGFSAGDLVATPTGPNAFDHVYDPTLDPEVSDEQRMASVTQLFYVNNWLHDYWYDSGFDEASGNAQLDNYGRGGQGNDPLRAEAQDGGGLNNANMATPGDGISPRMQMYLWSARSELDLSLGAPLNQTLNTNDASFGPGAFDVTAEVVLVDDGQGQTTDACEAIINDVNGKIALIDRATCSFMSKVSRAETAGAVGVLIANHTPNAGPMAMPGGGGSQPNIGVLSLSYEDGQALKTALGQGAVTATLHREAGVRPDGTIDNMIVSHEWGHYLHHRLVLCSTNQCGGESEGWGDFLSLFTTIGANEDWGGSYADAIYATSSSIDSGYFGLRRAPYSVDPAKNAYTFKHVSNAEDLPTTFPQQLSGGPNSEVHRTGEVWTGMMLEGYVRMLQRTQGPSPAYDFDTARRRMADYIVAGMKLAPPDPTFNEQRDALLAAASASDLDDMLALAEGFAERGAGSCAVSPPRDSLDNVGVIESYEVAPTLTIESVTLNDDLDSCDDDDHLDAGERGTLTIEVSNRGPVALTAGSITVDPTGGDATLSETTLTVTDLPPYATASLTTEVSLASSASGPDGLALALNVDAAAACNGTYTRETAFRVEYDNIAALDSKTNFDSDIEVMSKKGDEAEVIWTRTAEEPLDVVWHGIDISHISDSNLETPDLEVSEDEDLVITMVHRHRFEFDDSTLWDGGVIEVRRVDEADWVDVADYDDPGYGGPLSNLADNPLSDRMAFVAENASWPDTDTVTVNLGDAYAGETIRVRFRIGTDQAAGDFGWEIHELAFEGIDNTPFPVIVPDESVCEAAPDADAGPDQEVAVGALVSLDGSASSDPEGAELTYQWEQIDGPSVSLDGEDGVAPTFTAPDEEAELTFTLNVSDGTGFDEDEVTIRVTAGAPAEVVEPLVIGNGCGCEMPGGSAPSDEHAAYLIALASAAALRRRRRS